MSFNLQVTVVQSNGNSNCSGSLISPRIVITSATCVRFSMPDEVTVFLNPIYTIHPYEVNKIFVHDLFNHTSRIYDVALLRITEKTGWLLYPIDFNQTRSKDCEVQFVHGIVS